MILEQEYFTQILHTGAQLTFIVLCFIKLKKNSSSILYYILIPSLISFIQTFINLKYFAYRNIIEINIATFLLIESYFHFTIIESYLNRKKVKILKSIKIFYCLLVIFILIFFKKDDNEKMWLSYLPIPIIIIFGIYAIKKLLKNNSTALIYNPNFWITYSVIFIQLSSLPIELINYLFVDTISYETNVIKLKAHQISYFFYHIILIYAIKWIPKKSA